MKKRGKTNKKTATSEKKRPTAQYTPILGKKGQESIGMSFNMIFSIFLIIIFVAVAFIAIRHFLSIGNTADVGFFYENLQENINQAWKGQAGEFKIDIDLPNKITTVCFANLSKPLRGIYTKEYNEIKDYEYYNSNVYLLPTGETQGQAHKELQHLNITKITSDNNPECYNTKEKLTIKKEFYDKLVSIE